MFKIAEIDFNQCFEVWKAKVIFLTCVENLAQKKNWCIVRISWNMTTTSINFFQCATTFDRRIQKIFAAPPFKLVRISSPLSSFLMNHHQLDCNFDNYFLGPISVLLSDLIKNIDIGWPLTEIKNCFLVFLKVWEPNEEIVNKLWGRFEKSWRLICWSRSSYLLRLYFLSKYHLVAARLELLTS